VEDHDLVVFGPGDAITVAAAPKQATDVGGLDLLLLGGLPIREPIAHYGPFLMNTRQQLLEAIEDFNAGRLGRIPAATVNDDAPD
jgi:redox-sensitive bicupin YhaK (pirin superfamily)